MEDHPIPQNVTGFQFRLIGTMTVKQFAYVAAGAVSAVLVYYMPLLYIIKMVLIPFFVLFGLGLAFVPIEGRPMDAMTMYYFRALFTPNQFIYKKRGGRIAIVSIMLHRALFPLGTKQKSQDVAAKEERLKILLRLAREGRHENDIASKHKRSIIVSLEEEKSSKGGKEMEDETGEEKEGKIHLEKERQIQLLDQQINTLKQTLNQVRIIRVTQPITPETLAARKKIREIERQLQEIQEQKRKLENEIIELEQRLASKRREREIIKTSSVRRIPTSIAQSVGLPKVSSPNLIGGIVKDARGNVLPNILIETRDKEGNPVRAFKTNGLGQFISATPLLNGTYHIELEDPRGQHRFNTIEIVADGTILDPLEILSVDQREARERLPLEP